MTCYALSLFPVLEHYFQPENYFQAFKLASAAPVLLSVWRCGDGSRGVQRRARRAVESQQSKSRSN